MNPARVHALHVAVMGPASTTVTGHGQTSPGTCRQAVGVAELRAAWHAAAAGRFRTSTPPHLADPGMARGEDGWSAPGEVVAVLGCHAFAGCTTVAVTLASAMAGPVRVVETAAPSASGLTGYATAELGPTGTGWVRSRRDHVVLDRRHHPGPVPLPDPGPTAGPGARARQRLVTVLDAGCHPEGPYADPGWVGPAVVAAQHLVLVTTATVPGMRRLEGVLEHLTPDHPGLVLAVRGPVRRRWRAAVRHSVGPLTRSRLGEVVPVPYDAGLAVHGLDTRPLPRGLLASATDLLLGLGLHDAHPFPTKGSKR